MREPYALRRFLTNKLDFNEDVLAWGRGTLERESERLKGVLVATDRRVAFYGEGRFRGGVAFHEIPIRTMTRVAVGDADSSVEVECPQRVIRFVMQRRDEFEYVRTALEELRSGAGRNGAMANGAAAPEAASRGSAASDGAESSDASSVSREDAPGARGEREEEALAEFAPVDFQGIMYIRGLRGLVQPTEGRFVVTRDHVEFHVGSLPPERISLADITAIEVTTDTRLIPPGEKNRSAVLKLAASQPPGVGGPLPLGARSRVDTVTIWYLSISFRSGAESGVALFSVSSWGSAEKKAAEVVEVIKRYRSLAHETGGAGAEGDVASAPAGEAAGDGADRRAGGRIRERLVELKELFESELISESEYAEKRKELLAKL
ncbi:MAG: SHOCT domain-containing protein [Deltaproteobacteria bacterium]|nr:SHOCT domain-containing protein [Deltaproteobacteria bacterium]